MREEMKRERELEKAQAAEQARILKGKEDRHKAKKLARKQRKAEEAAKNGDGNAGGGGDGGDGGDGDGDGGWVEGGTANEKEERHKAKKLAWKQRRAEEAARNAARDEGGSGGDGGFGASGDAESRGEGGGSVNNSAAEQEAAAPQEEHVPFFQQQLAQQRQRQPPPGYDTEPTVVAANSPSSAAGYGSSSPPPGYVVDEAGEDREARIRRKVDEAREAKRVEREALVARAKLEAEWEAARRSRLAREELRLQKEQEAQRAQQDKQREKEHADSLKALEATRNAADRTRQAELIAWLRQEELEEAYQLLVDNGFSSLKRLQNMTPDVVEAFGFPPGTRLAMLAALNKLRSGVGGGGGGGDGSGRGTGRGGQGHLSQASRVGMGVEQPQLPHGFAAAPEGMWTCKMCSFHNTDLDKDKNNGTYRVSCSMCFQARPFDSVVDSRVLEGGFVDNPQQQQRQNRRVTPLRAYTQQEKSARNRTNGIRSIPSGPPVPHASSHVQGGVKQLSPEELAARRRQFMVEQNEQRQNERGEATKHTAHRVRPFNPQTASGFRGGKPARSQTGQSEHQGLIDILQGATSIDPRSATIRTTRSSPPPGMGPTGGGGGAGGAAGAAGWRTKRTAKKQRATGETVGERRSAPPLRVPRRTTETWRRLERSRLSPVSCTPPHSPSCRCR